MQLHVLHGAPFGDLPRECLPQGPRKGNANYAIKCTDASGDAIAFVQVHLANRKFWIKKAVGGLKASPSVSWAKHGGLQAAWDFAKQLSGWQ